MASFMTIYSVYYYTQIRKLDQSVVANVKDLKSTILGLPVTVDDSYKNYIITQGLSQVLGELSMSDLGVSPVPNDHFAAYNGPKTKDNLEKFYEGLVTKFPNHPPIDFDTVKEGEKIAMSYFFYNMRFPEGFRVSARLIDFKGEKVRSLQYHPKKADTSLVTVYKNDKTSEYALRIKLNGGTEEAVIYSKPGFDDTWVGCLNQAATFITQTENRYTPASDESVLIPELDVSLVKDQNAAYFEAHPKLRGYALAEERIKIKMSAPKEGGPMEVDERFNTPKNIILNGNILMYIRDIKKGPYCVIRLKNPEILKVVKSKK